MVRRATLICALALAAGPCLAGDSLESLFRENSRELTLEDGRLSGPATELLLAETEDAQFLCLAEPHNPHEIPVLIRWYHLIASEATRSTRMLRVLRSSLRLGIVGSLHEYGKCEQTKNGTIAGAGLSLACGSLIDEAESSPIDGRAGRYTLCLRL